MKHGIFICFTRNLIGTNFVPRFSAKPLHHIPTRGGSDEHQKHRQQYLQTLDSYAENFGAPPNDIWPSVQQAFSMTEKRVNKAGSVIKSQLKELLHPRQIGKKCREVYQNFMQKDRRDICCWQCLRFGLLDPTVVQRSKKVGIRSIGEGQSFAISVFAGRCDASDGDWYPILPLSNVAGLERSG